MRIGLVTDVHNHHEELAAALAQFARRDVDFVVALGDVCDPFCRGGGELETAALLDAAGILGVWGNHDMTLCRDVDPEIRSRYPSLVFDVMSRMQPRLVIGDCSFTHREASADPFDIEQMWEFGDDPFDLMKVAGLAFGAVDTRLQFVGHYHRWCAATPAGRVAWNGNEPLRFEPGERYFVVVAAVCEGLCGILDVDRGELEPLSCRVVREL